MMSIQYSDEETMTSLKQSFRHLSTNTVLFHHALSAKIGLSYADHKYLEIILQSPSITAGKLAEYTGLTTGAITGVIDRLEKAGLVKRCKDPHDRRRVIIKPVPENIQKIQSLFSSLNQAIDDLCSRYQPEELSIIHDFVNQTIEILKRETEKLTQS